MFILFWPAYRSTKNEKCQIDGPKSMGRCSQLTVEWAEIETYTENENTKNELQIWKIEDRPVPCAVAIHQDIMCMKYRKLYGLSEFIPLPFAVQSARTHILAILIIVLNRQERSSTEISVQVYLYSDYIKVCFSSFEVETFSSFLIWFNENQVYYPPLKRIISRIKHIISLFVPIFLSFCTYSIWFTQLLGYLIQITVFDQTLPFGVVSAKLQ